jgi:Skp family chaperone for outer membrane proteins
MRTLVVLLILVIAFILQLAQWIRPSGGYANSERALQELRVPVEPNDTEHFQQPVD